MKTLLQIPAHLGAASPAIADDAAHEMLEAGLEISRLAGIYLGSAAIIFAVLMFAGRWLKQRMSIPFGPSFNIFCMLVALYLPTLSPFIPVPGRRNLGAAVIIAAAFVLDRLIRHYLFDLRRKRKEGPQVPKFFGDIVSAAIIIGAIFAVLQIAYGVKVPGVLAGAGIAGLVLGLALQDTLGNVFSGFAIYFGGQFKAGDWLLVDGHHAKIVEINWRSTRLRTNDDVTLDIPNSSITKQTIINYNSPTSIHGMRMEIGLDYDSAPALVKTVLVEAALDCPYVLRNPEPSVFMKRFADWSIIYELRYWLGDHKHYGAANSQINTALWHSLKRNGISIPYPIRSQKQIDTPAPPAENFSIIREALKHSLLASLLSEAPLDDIARRSRIVHFGQGENIIRQGATADSMFILIQGRAEVWIESDGKRTRVAELGPDACIGESSVLTGEPRGATVRAMEDCTAAEIQQSALTPIITADPALLETLSELLARKRMENEGLITAGGTVDNPSAEKHYKAGFLGKLHSLFKI